MFLVCTTLPRKDSKMSKLGDVCWISSLLCCYFLWTLEKPVILSPLSCTQMDSVSSTHGETCFLVWVKSPFYLDRTEKQQDWRILDCWIACEFWFWFSSLEGWYTAANRDALSSTSSSCGGVDKVIKRTYPYKEVLR